MGANASVFCIVGVRVLVRHDSCVHAYNDLVRLGDVANVQVRQVANVMHGGQEDASDFPLLPKDIAFECEAECALVFGVVDLSSVHY